MDRITLRRPDDWHVHLRDGDALRAVVGHTAAHFGRAIVMPNLERPVRTVADAADYRARILAALPDGVAFTPLMTLYLTDATAPGEVRRARDSGFVHAIKLYPAGATTNSDAGVTGLDALDPVLDAMATEGMPLLVHGEVTHGDVFDREALFLEAHLAPLVARHPALKVVLEHVTTEDGVRFVQQARAGVAATITPHHLLLDRNALFVGGIRPHNYCLPVLKRARHRDALVRAATSGSPRFFLGTDSAPHERATKETSCGCAGCYVAPHALALYAEAFDAAGALHRLGGFASEHGPAFYGLPANDATITLIRDVVPVPDAFPFAHGTVVPLRAGGTVGWRVASGAA